jgi:hypothetical protein
MKTKKTIRGAPARQQAFCAFYGLAFPSHFALTQTTNGSA